MVSKKTENINKKKIKYTKRGKRTQNKNKAYKNTEEKKSLIIKNAMNRDKERTQLSIPAFLAFNTKQPTWHILLDKEGGGQR